MTPRRTIASALGLTVALILTLPAGVLAQEEAGEQAPETLVVSQWKCDYSHIGDIRAENDSLAFPIWQDLVDEGMIESVGTFYHEWGDAWNYNTYYVAEDKEAFFAAWDEFVQRIEQQVGEEDEPAVFEYCTEHKDNIYTLGQSTNGS